MIQNIKEISELIKNIIPAISEKTYIIIDFLIYIFIKIFKKENMLKKKVMLFNIMKNIKNKYRTKKLESDIKLDELNETKKFKNKKEIKQKEQRLKELNLDIEIAKKEKELQNLNKDLSKNKKDAN